MHYEAIRAQMIADCTIRVEDVDCDRCEEIIRVALGAMRGVAAVRTDRASNSVEVSYQVDKITVADVCAWLADIGFEPVG